ncbi:reverse transcriptase domain-containing protein [Apilactobacillus xinyiensis]|uniref:reverse transcriptase domain-containing protein n=1 Tax=Apilactobacillus xinyiensis TaxID=2841032 RepID=UPI001C7E147F|nr:reverse transcriptase domain-containing protein [Apilactobacillus xinyiensis]MCL0330791.1 reverse transcriptase domain-containing protein [Apilactobacillus xinyiensis]
MKGDTIDINYKKVQKVLEKSYRHFDYNPSPKSAEIFIRNVVFNPKKVEKYRFYPFIMFNKKRIIYHRTKGKLRAHLRIKNRTISLVAHHDALIYIHYANLLSKNYENYLSNYSNEKLEMVPTAYRKKLHSSNITAAKEVFDFIVDSKDCLIIKGDFKGFFDNLRHKILIKNICKVMDINELKPDWKSVIKSLTKYRSTYSEDILKSMKKIGLKNNANFPYVKNRKEITILTKYGGLFMHGPNQIGIPQGTSLSAILANVYMIEFDQIINKLINNLHGIYRRYSDDFIIVIPNKYIINDYYTEVIDPVFNTCKKYTKLTIEKHKTKVFTYKDNKIKYIKNSNIDYLDYLGFNFNGDTVRIREKSIYKFHYKSKKIINALISSRKYMYINNNTSEINPSKHSRKVWRHKEHKLEKLYQPTKQNEFLKKLKRLKYSRNIKNLNLITKSYLSTKRYGKEWSMISYAKKAQKIFEKNNKYDVKIINQINKQIKENQKRINQSNKQIKENQKRINQSK